MLETNKPKADKKQITLSFKTKDPRELELFEFFSHAMGRQALIKNILWEYYQKSTKDGLEIPTPVVITSPIKPNDETHIHNESDYGIPKRRNTPRNTALLVG